MRLFILLFFCFHGICWASNFYCVHQPKTLHVKEGDSVTIPCSYTFPEDHKGKSQIIVTWWEAYTVHCSSVKKYIIENNGNIHKEYKDRISAVNHPDNQTASIVIRGLKASDGITFCCGVTVVNARYQSNDVYGTFLNLAGGKWLSQVEELIAVEGEELIIPCHHPLKTLREALQVTWYGGYTELCDVIKNEIYKWDQKPTIGADKFSLVNISEDFSLRIHRVQSNGHPQYCCRVTTSDREELKSRISTELIIAGPSSSSSTFTVTQPYNITGHIGQSVNISYFYSRYMESDVLGVDIYWRVGNTSGPYVYHPYKEMIHPDYRGRTEMQDEAGLQIRGLQMSDNSMYYCFVMIRLCTGNSKYKKLAQYGEGTRLIVTEPSPVPDEYLLVIIISITVAILLVLLFLILIILKITGVICKKKNVSGEMKTAENPENVEFDFEEKTYCEISTKSIENNQAAECTEETNENEMQGEKDEPENSIENNQAAECTEETNENEMQGEKDEPESENILYSELNKTKLQQRNPATYQKPEEETVYAAVVSPDSRK
ncbi:paired immunoglobulin-like type 2 receptor alpha isoform X1 [Bufo bufo]|uniref:paired immunoglobulin-like type 2 receptor alpha isoform X1 n=1 Tax=Bufo bufo TaxID=8384 RepID=UPI001ABE0FC7|nr:paired immunoglobulin-like type 2 receptor alpha isoform X1 [Bufo bufo]